MTPSIPVTPLLLDVENLCRWLEQPEASADGAMLADCLMKSHPAWVPHHAPFPHVNHLLDLLSQGERQLNDELRSTQQVAELSSIQKRQAILTLTRSIRRARKQTRRARLIVTHLKQAADSDLQRPLDLFLRMLSLQAQQFKALSQSADSAVLSLQRFSYRPTQLALAAPLAIPPVSRWVQAQTVLREGFNSFWNGSRFFRDWLMHPVIDSRTVPLLSRVPARSLLGDRKPSEPVG